MRLLNNNKRPVLKVQSEVQIHSKGLIQNILKICKLLSPDRSLIGLKDRSRVGEYYQKRFIAALHRRILPVIFYPSVDNSFHIHIQISYNERHDGAEDLKYSEIQF